ncbi:MAG TPA: S41 family peptidase [Brevundimonas sp.]|nr:S41 family peptidase [Brevundimonas sp.]
MTALTRRNLIHLSAGAALAAAAGPVRARPTQRDLRDDVAILRQAWETLHPGLYRYNTADQIRDRLTALETAWLAAPAFADQLLALTRATATVRCGHTYPSPYNSADDLVASMYPGRTLVPFRFRWIGGRMIVTNDDSAEGIFSPGSIVTAINGAPCERLLAALIPLARADGGNDPKRISLMEVRGDDGYETFDIHLPLILRGLEGAADFALSDGRTVRAGLLSLEQRRAKRAAPAPGGDVNPWTLVRRDDGVAVLTMPSWSLYRSTFDWRGWLGGVMGDLTATSARGLIVDLRGNEGGLDCGDVILSRLIGQDLALADDQRWTRYRSAPDHLHPHLKTWDRSFLDWGDSAAGPDARGFYRLSRFDDVEAGSVLRPEGRRFAGPVIVLCDASNSSATFQFARTVKDNGLATLMGQTTGGNRRGINGGAFFFLTLPATGFVVDLPLIASLPVTPQPDAGIEPDIRVETTAEDIAAGRDPEMAAAIGRLLVA